jgi:hypothetical protein
MGSFLADRLKDRKGLNDKKKNCSGLWACWGVGYLGIFKSWSVAVGKWLSLKGTWIATTAIQL